MTNISSSARLILVREIHDYLMKNLAELNHHPTVERCDVARDNLMKLVTLGRGVTLTSEATTGVAFPGIVYRPIADETLPFSAVWSPRNDNPAFRRLLSMARTFSKQATTMASRNMDDGSELLYQAT
ncbi:hypothetical protein [Nitrospirillum amazonense]|uniref:hypothetical protein n=1 Tax=Nitrospirillum amazonense TaxID=28077 RepID=UPI001B3BDE7A|nr:hypothetical protein [Nitrospirillum amazonense]